jgi:hypothetical protein
LDKAWIEYRESDLISLLTGNGRYTKDQIEYVRRGYASTLDRRIEEAKVDTQYIAEVYLRKVEEGQKHRAKIEEYQSMLEKCKGEEAVLREELAALERWGERLSKLRKGVVIT